MRFDVIEYLSFDVIEYLSFVSPRISSKVRYISTLLLTCDGLSCTKFSEEFHSNYNLSRIVEKCQLFTQASGNSLSLSFMQLRGIFEILEFLRYFDIVIQLLCRSRNLPALGRKSQVETPKRILNIPFPPYLAARNTESEKRRDFVSLSLPSLPPSFPPYYLGISIFALVFHRSFRNAATDRTARKGTQIPFDRKMITKTTLYTRVYQAY